MIPSLDDLTDAQHAINGQQPALSNIPEGQTRPFELTSRQAATIAAALGVTSAVVRDGVKPAPVRVGWAAIIESALAARGGARLDREVLEALHRVEPSTLERMAALVLGLLDRLPPSAPDTPETVAAKCIAARAVADAFRERVVEPLGVKRGGGR